MPQVTRLYRWYVLYTRCNHEEAAEGYLKRNSIETYLPRQKVLRQWADRKKWMDVPLFPSYIFVRVSCLEYEKALKDSSISHYVTLEGYPCAVPDEQINAIQIILNQRVGFEMTNERFGPGDQVVVKEGPLAGYRAEVVECKGKKELGLRVGCTNQAMLITTECDYVISNN